MVPRRSLVLLAVVAAGMLTGCRPGTVRISFRPEPGVRYAYEVTVRSMSTIRLGDRAPQETDAATVLQATHTVLEGPEDVVRVRVELRRPGADARTFVVRLDRAARLEEIERIEGLPAEALGELGLSEIFPAAAGAPPDRPLEPGDQWRIADEVRLPGSSPARLVGRGQLEKLSASGGHKLASVRSRTRLPVQRTTQLRQGTLALDGHQTTESTTRHDLADGSIHRARSLTRGQFAVVLSPPAGVQGTPVRGTLVVEVTSAIERRE